MQRRILLMDDEDAIRSSLVRALARDPSWRIVDAGTLDEGLKLIDKEPPDLIVTDIDMPGRTGIEVLGELGKRGLKVPVIFLTAYSKAFGAQIPKHRDIDVREKPISIDELRALISERLASKDASPASPFSPTDYLQISCMGSHSVTIELSRHGTLVGEIVVVRGEVWSARDERSIGKEAFARLMFDDTLRAECRGLEGQPPERNLQARWESLLLECARERDERARDGEIDVDVESEPAAQEDTVDPFTSLWDQALDALLRKDHATALRAFEEAQLLRPDDQKVAANIRRLRDLGMKQEERS